MVLAAVYGTQRMVLAAVYGTQRMVLAAYGTGVYTPKNHQLVAMLIKQVATMLWCTRC